MSYFEITSTNRLGTPSGILHTDKPLNELSTNDLTNRLEELNLEFAYPVKAYLNTLYIGDHFLGYYCNGIFFDDYVNLAI